MLKQIIVIIIAALFFLPDGALAAAPAETVVRVGVAIGQISVLVSADTDYELIDYRGRTVGRYKPLEKVSVSARNVGMAVNGATIETAVLTVRPAATGGEHYIEVNRGKYRGDMVIQRTTGRDPRLTAINTLPLEQYLYGTVPKEIAPDWPAEAVKAQAVAARTYTIYNMNKHSADGFDVCATTDCQVYGGRDSENLRSTKAVDDTRGLIAAYRGKPINAVFHSSAGGYTESSENVWGSYVPYLRAVTDFDQKGPSFKWERIFTPTQLEQALRDAGYPIGKLKTIELSKLTKQPVVSSDRGQSGRVKSVVITGSEGTISITGAKLRSILALPSTLFDFQTVLPVKKSVEFEITDSYGDREIKQVDINIAPYPEKGFLTDKENVRRVSYRQDEQIVISGFGSGHGIGLSQWGAKAMAEKAPPGEAEYFKIILKHYYQGIEVQKLY